LDDGDQNIIPENLPDNNQKHMPPASLQESKTFTAIKPPLLIQSSTSKFKKKMEIHHHGHVHEQAKWKEYLFQFLMLFLAIFLSFWAENQRERSLEGHKEKEYIESLMTDIDNDYSKSRNISSAISVQVKTIDTLQTLFFDLQYSSRKDSIIRKCYDLSSSILIFYSDFFNERTISQLLSSGNMRLIKKQGVADSIMDYHSLIKFVEVQKQLYINTVNSCVQSMYDVYDISYLKTIMQNDTLYNPDLESVQLQLRTTNEDEFKKFISILEITKVVAFTYKNYLTDISKKAERLYEFLKEKYKIEI